MKKIILLLCCFCVSMSISMSVNAQEFSQKVGQGYTSEGVYYEVFAMENAEDDISLCGTSLSVTREVIYSGVITPPTELSWRESIHGVYYTGVLKLNQFTCTSTETVAIYKGVLYEE